MRICNNCGAELKDGQKFCNKCGTEYKEIKLAKVASSEEAESNRKRYITTKKLKLLIVILLMIVFIAVLMVVMVICSNTDKGTKNAINKSNEMTSGTAQNEVINSDEMEDSKYVENEEHGNSEALNIDGDANKNQDSNANIAANNISGIELNHSYYYLNPNESVTLYATAIPNGEKLTDVTWTSGNPEYVSVDNGVVTPLKNGFCKVVIIAETADGKKAQCYVMSRNKDTSVIYSSNGLVYSEFPSVLAFDNVLTNPPLWNEFDVSYPEYGIYSYHYLYQFIDENEARKQKKAYTDFLAKNGYTQTETNNNKTVFISPDQSYIVEVEYDYSAMIDGRWTIAYYCDVSIEYNN